MNADNGFHKANLKYYLFHLAIKRCLFLTILNRIDLFIVDSRLEDDIFWEEMNNVDYSKIKISDLLKKEKERIIYEYDFGDGWEHDIILEKIEDSEMKNNIPSCLLGKNSCPPEDCGGTWGYSNLLEILKNPDHAEYEEYIDWLDEEFDPKYFDKIEINKMLKTKDFGCFEMF